MRVALEDRAVVSVEGEEAARWLQNLITCDVTRLAIGQARSGALLTPQGKILFDFLLVRAGETRFFLDVATSQAEALAKRLMFYRLRAKIRIDVETDLRVYAGEVPPPDAVAAPDPRHPTLGTRFYSPGGFAADPATGWEAARIAAGIPEGGKDFAFGDAFPHEAQMDRLGGIDFQKGCYVGQEVVSRMEHRGTARTRIVPVTLSAPASPGMAVIAGDRTLGTLGSTAGNRALAMLRLDRVEEAQAAGEPIHVGGATLQVAPSSAAG